MNRHYLLLLSLTLILGVCGCSSVKPAKRQGNIDLESLKSAYVVWPPGIDRRIDEAANEALEKHGVKVTTGPRHDKPTDVAFYVECEPRWTWDLVMYLSRLNIRFIDNATGQLLVSGEFKNSWLHTNPDPRTKTIEVIDSMYRRE